MELLTFIFDVAKLALSRVIAELISDKTKELRKEEIRNVVIATIKETGKDRPQHNINSEQMKQVVQEVMDEIEIISGRDPDIKFDGDKIVLAKPVRNLPLLPFPKKDIDLELSERLLQRLDETIAKRRAEVVGVSTDPEEPSVEWKYVGKQEDKNYWEQRLIDMEDRIRRRRAGEVIGNE